MDSLINNSSFEYSEEKSFYYAVLRKVLELKSKGLKIVSISEVHELIYKPHFKVPIEQVERVIVELYDHSLLGRWEYENGEVKYELSF